jgi:hypothetical protein
VSEHKKNDRGSLVDIAHGEKVEQEPTAMISRHRHERQVWTGSDGCAVDSSRLRDYARGGGWAADAPMRQYKAGRRAAERLMNGQKEALQTIEQAFEEIEQGTLVNLQDILEGAYEDARNILGDSEWSEV